MPLHFAVEETVTAAELRGVQSPLPDVRILQLSAKAIPLQAWTGLEGSRRLRLPDFKTVGT